MKDLQIYLPYFKQGCDLGGCLESTETNGEALELHANMLKSAAEQLLKIKKTIDGHKVDIQADTHFIGICGEDDIMDELVEAKLAEEMDWEDEEENE